MNFTQVHSYDEFSGKIRDFDTAYLVLIKKGSAISDCALKNIAEAKNDDARLFVADVAQVRDIHDKFGIKSVPALLAFEKGVFQNVVKGCNHPGFYQSFFEHASYSGVDEAGQPAVTVYTTPTCSWCNTLKSHLRNHKIRFHEVDVSSDPSLAEELVRKSGQQGVPQTEINGEIIVGFDKTRINRLLNIN
jgi:glutaredoxin-like YruB-family protein